MKDNPKRSTIKKLVLIGLGLFILVMFILPFGYFLATGEFPKGYPIQVGKKIGEKEAGIKYVCPDGTVVSSPELCPKKEETPPETQPQTKQTAVPNQTLLKGEIELNLGAVQEDVKSYLISWYNEFYSVLENITGGPCKPFEARVVYSPVGSGGSFMASAIGQDATILLNMPLDKTKEYDANFDSRFGHEFIHGFMNGIRSVTARPVTVSFVDEGFAEVVTQIALLEKMKAGKSDYKLLGHYLPYHVASYDAYAIQGKNTAGGPQMWFGDNVGWYYKQAEVVWYFMEQAKPGFIKEFLRKSCSLPQTSEGETKIIYMSYEQYKNIVKEIFGNTKIEGKSAMDWFDSQPVTNTDGEPGTYLRIMFDTQGRISISGKPANPVGRSINPGIIKVSAVKRTISSQKGPEDEAIATNPVIKIFNWQGSLVSEPANRFVPSLPIGAYKVEASDSSLNAKTATYFVITDTVDEDSLYGIKLENEKIVASGTVKSSLGDVQINNGFFVLKVPSNIKEVNFQDVGRTVIKPIGMARMIILQ